MPRASFFILSITLPFALCSCQLIASAVNTAARLWPLLLVENKTGGSKPGALGIESRARQIDHAPEFDGRMNWITNAPRSRQGVAAR